jgi:hypothetical protein
MSLDTIRQMEEEAALKARDQGRVPYEVTEADIAKWREAPGFPFPFIGRYIPKGWHLIHEYFVDSSGFGEQGEAALTVSQFIAKLTPGHGYALREVGQFQVYVGEYVRL